MKARFDLKNLFEQSLIIFPVLTVGLTGYFLLNFLKFHQTSDLLLFLLMPYTLPLLVFRVISFFSPLKSGAFYIAEKGYTPWLGAYKLQLLYLYFPYLERILRMFPGLFSLWLRCWGSEIGKSVYWTPHINILDRTHLKIGNGVIFGHDVNLTCHAIKVKNGRFLLYLNHITIGDYSLIGAWAKIAPGVHIKEGSQVDVGTHLYPNARSGATDEKN